MSFTQFVDLLFSLGNRSHVSFINNNYNIESEECTFIKFLIIFFTLFLLLQLNIFFFLAVRQLFKSIISIQDVDFIQFQIKNMINEDLPECKSSFAGRRGDFDVNIFLIDQEDKSNLSIDLRNQSKMSYFGLKINNKYIQQNAEMAFCFESSEDLFHTLIELFQQLTITDDGILIFEMKLNSTKLKKKVFRLQTIKKNIDQSELMKLKLEAIHKQLKSQIISKNAKIASLSQTTLKQEEAIMILKKEVAEMKQEQEELFLENKKKDFKMNNIIKENQLQRQEIAYMRKNLDQFHKKFSLLEFYNYFDNPHWHYFSVYKGEQSVKIIKKDNDSTWYNFIRNTPLTEGKTYEFKIKQIKTSYRNIMIGIGLKESFGVSSAYKLSSCISYNCYSGNVWQKGSSRKGGLTVYDGQTLSIEINLMNYKLQWMIDSKKSAQASITEVFKNKEIYLFLQFYNIDDELQLMLY